MACSIRHSLKLGLRCDLVPPGQTWPLPLCPLSAPLHSGKIRVVRGVLKASFQQSWICRNTNDILVIVKAIDIVLVQTLL